MFNRIDIIIKLIDEANKLIIEQFNEDKIKLRNDYIAQDHESCSTYKDYEDTHFNRELYNLNELYPLMTAEELFSSNKHKEFIAEVDETVNKMYGLNPDDLLTLENIFKKPIYYNDIKEFKKIIGGNNNGK